ncbi:MAG TPA: hypothetical protein VGF40_09090 [Thermoanaerobaculia bacterium]
MLEILTAVIPQADPLPLPGPPWLLRLLLVVTFFLHTLAMNFVLGGSLFVALSRTRGVGVVGVRSWIAKLMPTMVATAVTLGVAALLFAQTLYGRVLFSGSVIIAWWWLAVIPALIAAYYGTYLLAFRHGRVGRSAATVVALLFVAIAFVYVNNMSLMIRPGAFLGLHIAEPRGFSLNFGDPTLAPRFAHMLLSAVAVVGAVIALYGLTIGGHEPAKAAAVMRQGARWFLGATALNIVAGIGWVAAMPHPIRRAFVGGDAAATASMWIGTLFGLAAFAAMVVAARADRPASGVRVALWALGATIFVMVIARDQLRVVSLRAAGFRITDWVEPQWGVIAIFLALFVAGIATTVWMVSLIARPHVTLAGSPFPMAPSTGEGARIPIARTAEAPAGAAAAAAHPVEPPHSEAADRFEN